MEYTILVNSCDAYADLWEVFFKLLKKYWHNVNGIPIMLNAESKSFSMEGLQIIKPELSAEDCDTWSKRFRACLDQIKTKYVVILLDDFWLEADVDTNRLEYCIEAMEADKEIKSFSFVPTLWKNKNDKRFAFFELRRKGPYILNLQAGLWRVDEMKSFIIEDETPWEFEELGSYRAARVGGKYYVAKEGCPQVFTYNWRPGGAVHRGRWTEGADLLSRSVGVDIDYGIRGWDKEFQLNTPKVKKTLRKRVSDFVWPFVEWYKYFR